MKKLFSGLFYKWLAMTFVYIIAFHALDYVFGNSASISFLEAGFFAFVALWCAQQDKIKREGKWLMNDEKQDGIRNILDAALNKIYEDYGVCVTEIKAEWLDASTYDESKRLLTFVEIEAEL